MLFVSLYFYTRYSKAIYITSALFGSLLLFSTLNRATIGAAILGLMLICLLIIWGTAGRVRAEHMLNVTLYPSVIAVGGFFLIIVIMFSSAIRFDGLIGSIYPRFLFLVRGLDVWVYTFWLGTGPFLHPYFLGSSFVPMTVSQMIFPYFGISTESALMRLTREGVLVPEGMNSYTLHNQWLQFIVDWGIAGQAIVIWLWMWLWRIFRRACVVQRTTMKGRKMTHLWCLFAFAISLSLSVLFTSKFYLYWYFVLLFLWLDSAVKEISFEVGNREVLHAGVE